MNATPDDWEIFRTEADFASLRGDSKLHELLTLARIVNSIRFNQTVILDLEGKTDPRAMRQRTSALFYLGALVHEGLKFARSLGKHFRSSKAFKDCLAPILNSKSTRSLESGLLERLRNKAVYHHDRQAIPEGLSPMQSGNFVFASGRGRLNVDVYYDLADITLMFYALGGPKDTETFAREAKGALVAIVDLASKFATCSDRLIGERLRNGPWRRRRMPP